MAFHDPAPATRDCPHLSHGDFTLCDTESERRQLSKSQDKAGLARQLLDAFKLINDLQLQINQLRLHLRTEIEERIEGDDRTYRLARGDAAMDREDARPADDDAGEWSNTLLAAQVGESFTKTEDGWRKIEPYRFTAEGWSKP